MVPFDLKECSLDTDGQRVNVLAFWHACVWTMGDLLRRFKVRVEVRSSTVLWPSSICGAQFLIKLNS